LVFAVVKDGSASCSCAIRTARQTTLSDNCRRPQAGEDCGCHGSGLSNGFTVRPANREQIKEAIRALNFERNATALTITTDITHVAGFLAPSFDEYHGVMLEHLSRALRRDGRALLIYRHGADTRLMEDVSNTSPPSGSTR